jgi:hypothetical protein
MRTTWHHGMKHEVSVEQFRREFQTRRARASIVLAKKVAAKMAKSSLERIALNYDRNVVLADRTLADMARLHQVVHELIPFTVKLTRQICLKGA